MFIRQTSGGPIDGMTRRVYSARRTMYLDAMNRRLYLVTWTAGSEW